MSNIFVLPTRRTLLFAIIYHTPTFKANQPLTFQSFPLITDIYAIFASLRSFGFVHDQKFPSPQDDKKTIEKKLDVLVQREKKWIKMLSKWDSKSTREKLPKRIYKGIPDKVRNVVWSKLLNLSEIMTDRNNANKYQKMLKLAREHGTEARQIDSDVNRQFRENIFFRERYNLKQQQLFNVLVVSTMREDFRMCLLKQ